MSEFFSRLKADPPDFTVVPEACRYFEAQYKEALEDVKMKDRRIGEIAGFIGGAMAHRWQQYTEIQAMMNFIELLTEKEKQKARKGYIEQYKRALTERQAEKYADAADAVIELRILFNDLAYVRGLFEGISKGLNANQYMINPLTTLRDHSIDDATV